MRVSIAMAVYNGEKYLDVQIQSILKQLTDDDELVISYNRSTDNTLNIINSYAEKDSRIKVFINAKEGIKENFSHAVDKCRGKYIFYADQDDVWLDNKLERVLSVFEEKGVSLVVHDARYTDADLNPLPYTIFENRKTKKGVIHNIIKGGFYGCCMAFSSELKRIVFPIPREIPSHDMWTGIMAGIYGEIALVDEVLIYYRRHGNNISPEIHGTVMEMLRNRFVLVKNILIRRRELRRKNIRRK